MSLYAACSEASYCRYTAPLFRQSRLGSDLKQGLSARGSWCALAPLASFCGLTTPQSQLPAIVVAEGANTANLPATSRRWEGVGFGWAAGAPISSRLQKRSRSLMSTVFVDALK